jgi:DNA-binding protein
MIKTTRKNIISYEAMSRLFLRVDDSVRVANDVEVLMSQALESYGHAIAMKSIELMRHRGRKTIIKSDVKLALKSINK